MASDSDDDVQNLRNLMIEFVRDHATLPELLEIAALAEPRVIDVLNECDQGLPTVLRVVPGTP
jgi:hypothetical protein